VALPRAYRLLIGHEQHMPLIHCRKRMQIAHLLKPIQSVLEVSLARSAFIAGEIVAAIA
jgi:hypothetical protein